MTPRREQRETTAGDMIASGLVILGITAFVALLIGTGGGDGDGNRTVGLIVAGIGGVLGQTCLLIGVVAKGVEIGARSGRR